MGRLVFVLCLLASTSASAEAIDSPDVQAAKRHFAVGTTLYNEGRYADAIVEFERAKQTHTAPAFDFNIARCLERLERWGEAAEAYSGYLKSLAPGPEHDEIVTRIDVLRKRTPPPTPVAPAAVAATVAAPPPPPPPPKARTKPWVWGVVGGVVGVVVVGAVVAGVVVGTAKDPSHPIEGVTF